MKTCNTCKEEKLFTEFHKNAKNKKDGLQGCCKSCNNSRVRKWQSENPDKFEANWRNQYGNPARRAKKYGLTVVELENLLLGANGVCTICSEPPNQWLVVDHCHTSGKVRGILCEKCNQALGLFRDNTDYLSKAIEYLTNFKNAGV